MVSLNYTQFTCLTTVIIMDDSRVLLHADKEKIGKVLRFCQKKDIKGSEEVLYEEDTPNGCIAMCRNQHTKPSYVDLEILFNATLSNPVFINSVFNHSSL